MDAGATRPDELHNYSRTHSVDSRGLNPARAVIRGLEHKRAVSFPFVDYSTQSMLGRNISAA